MSNPGSIRVGEEKVKIRVTRICDNESLITENPNIYPKLRSIVFPSGFLMRRTILGLSQQDYKEALKMGLNCFGLS